MRRSANCVSLKIGVDPDFCKRANSHQVLSYLDVVAEVDVATCYYSVDFADDIAVAEVQLGLFEIALGLQEFGLGLFEDRCLWNDVSIDAIEIALGILLVKLLDDLLGWSVPSGRFGLWRLRRGAAGEAVCCCGGVAGRLACCSEQTGLV